MIQRATTFSLLANHCPKALDFYEEGTPELMQWDPSAGTAAHDVLHRIGLDSGSFANVPAVCEALISTGRGGYDSGGPLKPDSVFEGRDIALAWADTQDWPDMDSEAVFYELGIGVTAEGCLTSYTADDAAWNSRADAVQILHEVDEDEVQTVLRVRDYKTPWPTSADDLDTIQRRSQAVAAMIWADALAEDIDVLRLEVINLRTHGRWSRDLWVAPGGGGRDTLKQWAKDIRIMVAAANRKPRTASPGAGCLGCPYSGPCLDFTENEAGRGHELLTWCAMIEAERTATLRQVRAKLGDARALPVPGGVVGYVPTPRAVVLPSAAETLLNAFSRGRLDPGSDAHRVAVAALKAPLSVTGVRKLAKACLPGRGQAAERRELIASCLGEETYPRFGIHKTKAVQS